MKEGRELENIENYVDEATQIPDEYVNKSKKGLNTATSNSNKNRKTSCSEDFMGKFTKRELDE